MVPELLGEASRDLEKECGRPLIALARRAFKERMIFPFVSLCTNGAPLDFKPKMHDVKTMISVTNPL